MAFFFVMLHHGTGSDFRRSFAVSAGVFSLALYVLILMPFLLSYSVKRFSCSRHRIPRCVHPVIIHKQ
jgi:hypothetical protein